MELWTVLISPLGLAATTGGFLLTGYLIYRYQQLGCNCPVAECRPTQCFVCGVSSTQLIFIICETWRPSSPSSFSLFSSSLSNWLLPFPYLLPSYAYAPFQVLKRCGIKGPQPKPFYGSYKEIRKLVCNRPLHACHSVVPSNVCVGWTINRYVWMYMVLASDTLRVQCIPLSKDGICGPEYHFVEHSCKLLGTVSLIANL